MTQAGVDVYCRHVRDHGVLDADFVGMDAAVVVAQEAVRCGEDIGQRDQSDELVAIDNRDVMNPVVVHQRPRFCQRGRRR